MCRAVAGIVRRKIGRLGAKDGFTATFIASLYIRVQNLYCKMKMRE